MAALIESDGIVRMYADVHITLERPSTRSLDRFTNTSCSSSSRP
jgi:hypothetical protein